MLEQKPLASVVSLMVLQSNGIHSLLTSVTFSPPTYAFTALKTPLCKQYPKRFQILFSYLHPQPPLPTSPTHIVKVLLCAHVCVCVCVCVCGVQGIQCSNYVIISKVLMYFVDLVKHGVLTLVGEILSHRSRITVTIITI